MAQAILGLVLCFHSGVTNEPQCSGINFAQHNNMFIRTYFDAENFDDFNYPF